jgi:uncharacterized protein YhhL (DUF1145 family)
MRDDVIQHCTALVAFASKSLSGPFERNHRVDLLMAFTHVAMKHMESILFLAETGNADPTVLALVRPMVETCARALWLFHVATEEVIDGFWKTAKGAFSREERPADVSLRFYPENHFVFIREGWSNMCGMTHTAVQQVAHCFDGDGNIVSNYPDNLIFAGMRACTIVFAMHAAKVLILLGRSQQAAEIRECAEIFRQAMYPPEAFNQTPSF